LKVEKHLFVVNAVNQILERMPEGNTERGVGNSKGQASEELEDNVGKRVGD